MTPPPKNSIITRTCQSVKKNLYSAKKGGGHQRYPAHMYLWGRYKVVSWLYIIVLKVETMTIVSLIFRTSQSIGVVANEGDG
jgi:hypothetical protein